MKKICSIAILGASGTIGSLVGGIIAQQGIKVHFVSRTLVGVKKGLDRAIKQARSGVISRHIECWDYEHGLEQVLNEANLIIESVSEDIEIKRHLYNMVERHRKPGAIVGTTTSSLPLNKLAEGRSDDFNKNFLSIHFYNPPGRMLACEITKTPGTDPLVYDYIKEFLEKKLQRVIIPVRNIPGFAGNRIAFSLFDHIVQLVEEYGVEMMDYLIGSYTGRIMPPLATLDLVGLDVHSAIIKSLKAVSTVQLFGLNDSKYVQEMVDAGFLGRKSGAGFHRRRENGCCEYYDPACRDYIPGIDPHVQFVERAKSYIHIGMYREAFDVIKKATGIEASIVKDTLAKYLSLSYSLIGEVTEYNHGISGIDDVMAYGFNWAPPSVLVNLLGGTVASQEFLDEMGYDVPAGLKKEEEKGKEALLGSGRFFISN